jgi:carbonic anhydrase/acetyltransferase-like protein (isoleucine patch superfamily)
MLKPLIKLVIQRGRLARLRLAGVRIRPPRLLGAHIECRRGLAAALGQIDVGPDAWIETGVVLHAYGGVIRIGRNVFLGPQVVVYGHGGVEIGDACLIAMHCRILSSNHTVAPFGTDIRSQPDVLLPTRLGRDVWLGAGVTILGGVTIGDGCVVGAGSVVTKDLPAGSICHGAPATVQGWRRDAPGSPGG